MSATLCCHRCGSANLELVEVTETYHSWDGPLRIVDGHIEPGGEAIHAEGDILLNRSHIRCHGCEHVWHPRRPIRDAGLHEGSNRND